MSISDTLPNGFRPLQVTGALEIVQKRRHLLADQPGSGKTLQALLAAELDGLFSNGFRSILIATTMTACQLTWAGELERRVLSQYDVVIADLSDPGKGKSVPSLPKRNAALADKILEARENDLPLIVLTNFESLRWHHRTPPKMHHLWDIEWDMVILDESHLVLPTKEDVPHKLTQFWYGLGLLRIKPNAIRLPMSGTPDRGKLENRYGTWKFLYPDAYTFYWGWVRNNFHTVSTDYNALQIGEIKAIPYWNAYDKEHMTRRTKSEMLVGLPEKQWAGEGGIDLPMTNVQKDAYEAYQEKLADLEETLLESDDPKDAFKAAGLKMQFALRARQMATCTWNFVETRLPDGSTTTTGHPIVAGPGSSNKLAWLADWLEARGYLTSNWDASLGKVVIVSYFVEVLNWLQTELSSLGVHTRILSGATNAATKVEIEAQFQRGDLRVVLMSGHLGVSINLDAADEMIFVDLAHDPDKVEQMEDRIHRASRMHQVTYWRLASLETIDQAVISIVDARYLKTRQSYDGARGVAFARKMLAGIPAGIA